MRAFLILVMLMFFAAPLSAMPEQMSKMEITHCPEDIKIAMCNQIDHANLCCVCASCAIVLISGVPLDDALGCFVDLSLLRLINFWTQRVIDHPLRPPIV